MYPPYTETILSQLLDVLTTQTNLYFLGFNNNWWVGLSLMHNIFTREHNAICDMLKKYPGHDWDDQKLYDTARYIRFRHGFFGISFLFTNHDERG